MGVNGYRNGNGYKYEGYSRRDLKYGTTVASKSLASANLPTF